MSTTTTTRWYICVYPHTWGRGETPEAAQKEARKRHATGRDWYIVEMPEGVVTPYVDQMGNFRWSYPEDWTPEQCDEHNAKAETKLVKEGRDFKRRRLAREKREQS